MTDSSPASARRVFAPERVLADLGGNRPALGQMIEAYLSQLHAARQSVETAQRVGDQAELARQVHRLRGAFAVLHAEPARRQAAELEHWLDEQHLPPGQLIDRLLREAERLAEALRAWRAIDPV